MTDAFPTQSLNTVIIVGTASATGLIVLFILDVFLCICIAVLCKQRSYQKRSFHPRTRELSHPPIITAPIRVHFQEDGDPDYSEVNPPSQPTHQGAQVQQLHTTVTVQQSHSQHSIVSQQGPHSHGLQRMPSIENMYSSVGGSQEALPAANRRLASVQVYREHVPTRRGEIMRDRGRGLVLSQREYTPEHSLSQSAEVGSITLI